MRRLGCLVVLVVLVSLIAAACAKAPESKPTQKFPTRQVNFICHVSPGSSADLFSRAVAKVLEREFGVSVAVENKPGGDGAIALSYLLSQPADGYWVCSITKSQVVAMASGTLGTITSPDQLHLLAKLQADPYVVAVRRDAPWKTLSELLTYAKSNPGKLTLGSFGARGGFWLSATEVAKKAGVEWKWVAYEGQADANKALLSGEIQVRYATLSNVAPYVRSGDFRLLAVSTAERSPQWPDVPTFKEQGIDYVDSQWRGVVARPGIPNDVLNVYYEALKKVATDPEMNKMAEKEGQMMTNLVGPQVQQIFATECQAAKSILAEAK